MVDAINGFLTSLRQSESDAFVVATSRQQGYRGELASGPVVIRHILPLSTESALHYVERYFE
ncbi:MAG TPA: hypothetical protein VJ323_09350 [Bryobacteraceae bacterium]|nr:hypothetical protein [Bryobacteraceae bacterium]